MIILAILFCLAITLFCTVLSIWTGHRKSKIGAFIFYNGAFFWISIVQGSVLLTIIGLLIVFIIAELFEREHKKGLV